MDAAVLLLLLLLLSGVAVAQPKDASQAQLLLDMKSHFNNSDILNSWLGDDPCNGWLLVTCDSKGSIISITLTALGLRGSIPPSGYQLPPTLQFLDLSANYLTGTLPADWRFPSLITLELERNQLTGTIPELLLPDTLEEFTVGGNLLTGTLPDFKLPSALWILTLDSNLLSGTIPASWELPPSLLWLNLCCQSLSGAIPASWALAPRNDAVRAEIGVFNNSLTGTLPSWNNSAPVTVYIRPGNPGLCGELPDSPMYHTFTDLLTSPRGMPLEAIGDCQPVAEPAGSSGGGSSNTTGIVVGVGVGVACLGSAIVGALMVHRRRQKRAYRHKQLAPPSAIVAADNSKSLTHSKASSGTIPASLGVLANNPALPPGDFQHPDGSTQAEAFRGDNDSLGSSDQSKLDISLWTVSFQEFLLQSLVGKGSFGRVYKAEWAQHTTVAVKVLDGHWPELAGVQATPDVTDSALPAPILAKLQQEASLLAALRHPNVVSFLGLVNSPPCLVTEFCPRGSLYDTLQQARKSPALASQLDWRLRMALALDAARGMAYLHSLNPPIVHCDFKSNNLLVCDNWACKVADFSVSKIWQESAVASSGADVGNPRWLAPEVLAGKSHTPASDVFSYGVVMWELLTWELPWAGCGAWQVTAAVVEGRRLSVPNPKALPEDSASLEGLPAYVQLMERCWAQSPQDRPMFAEIVEELSVVRRTSLDQDSGWSAGALNLSRPPRSENVRQGQDVLQGLTQGVVRRVSLSRHRVPSPFAAESDQSKLAAGSMHSESV